MTPEGNQPGLQPQDHVPDGAEYDHLIDSSAPNPDGSPEDAAMRPTDAPPARTQDRPGYWVPPTDQQVTKAADAAGNYDLGNQDKYFPPGSSRDAA